VQANGTDKTHINIVLFKHNRYLSFASSKIRFLPLEEPFPECLSNESFMTCTQTYLQNSTTYP